MALPTAHLQAAARAASRQYRAVLKLIGLLCGSVQRVSGETTSISLTCALFRAAIPKRGGSRLIETRKIKMGIGMILLIVLVLALVGVIPAWGHSSSWGYGPSGGVGLILVIVLILLLLGKI
jgi:hypothetical protein